jgi:hypothetical protein
MKRLAALTAGAAVLLSTGCVHDGEWSFKKAIGWDDPPPPNRLVVVPPKDLPPAPLAVAERVEVLGRKLVAQNTFLGVDPMFMTIGVEEPVLFHRGAEQLIISKGLVEKCSTDAELAAVLSSELGQMVAEKRTAKALGRDVEPIRDGAGPTRPGSAPIDAGQQANLAYHERQFPRGVAKPDPVDATNTARDLLKTAGYSPAELDRVELILKEAKQSDRGEQIKKQMSGSAPPPDWKK